MMQKYGVVLLFVLAAGGIAFYMHSLHRTSSGPTPAQLYPTVDGVQRLLTVEPKVAQQRAVSVLFTGNDLTSTNNLPVMLARIARSDAQSPILLEIQSDTHNGKGLREVWSDGQAVPLLRSRKWDYVVLQPDDSWINKVDREEELYRSVQVLAGAIRSGGSSPLIFMTWVKQRGSKWYKSADLQSPELMQQSLDYYTHDVAAKAGNIPVVAIGDFWPIAVRTLPKINLYTANGADPSFAGTYLAALLFYRSLTGRDLHNVTLVPPGLSPEDAASLRDLASQ